VAPKGKPEAPAAIDAKTGTSLQLREALSSPLPESGLPMAVQAAAFKGAAPNASVVVGVEFGGERFKYTEQNGIFVDNLEVSIAAVDASGKIRGGDRSNVELKLRPQTRQAVETFGFRILSRFDLAPGGTSCASGRARPMPTPSARSTTTSRCPTSPRSPSR